MPNQEATPEKTSLTKIGAAKSGPARGQKKCPRDLRHAKTLRPREVYELYGMPETTVSDLCTHPDPTKRIASYKVPGRQGRKGSRYIDHAEFIVWLSRWRCEGGAT